MGTLEEAFLLELWDQNICPQLWQVHATRY
jgi:hypothetical protein